MTTTKSYDNLNRLTQISSAPSGMGVSPVSFSYAYNSANQRTASTNADASRWSYGYDSLGQVTSGKKYWSDGVPVGGQQFDYAFDDIGNRKSATRDGRQSTYAANLLNQYTSRTVPGYVNILGEATNAATVLVNNMVATRKGSYYRAELGVTNTSSPLWLGITNLAVLNNGTNADIIATNTGNLFLPQTPETFAYDLDGNLTNDGRWMLTWDAENRLITMESQTAAPTVSKLKLEFAYDAQGRRIQKVVSTNNGTAYVVQATNKFAYDGWNLLTVMNAYLGSSQWFYWGLDLSGTMQGAGGVGGLLWARIYGPAPQFVAYDGNGNVAALIRGTTGEVYAQYEYGPFGELLRATGTYAKANPFRFSTKYQDDETDQLYYGYRFYNASTGRWPNRDPLGEKGGKNLYAFVRNAPVDLFDRFGLHWTEPYIGGGQLCTDCKCKAEALSKFSYIPEHGDGKLHSLPPPGQCVQADAVYTPGAAYKIRNGASMSVKCDAAGGNPTLKGDKSIEWKSGDPSSPPQWPDVHFPPYPDGPSEPPSPPDHPYELGGPNDPTPKPTPRF
jgi:RHS repeat-associated protein